MKLPGTYAAYALILAVFGETAAGIHLGLLVVNAISIVLLFLLASRLYGRLGGLVAAACSMVLTTSGTVLGFSGHAEHFVVAAYLAGLLLLLKAIEQILFELDPVEACRTVYFGNPFPEALQVADYIRAHSSPQSRVAVIGSEPEIYFYVRHLSATGYIYSCPGAAKICSRHAKRDDPRHRKCAAGLDSLRGGKGVMAALS